jgi:hypothetical protein
MGLDISNSFDTNVKLPKLQSFTNASAEHIIGKHAKKQVR